MTIQPAQRITHILRCFHSLAFSLTTACSLGILSISDTQRVSSTFYAAAARAGGGFATMNFNATPGGTSSLVFGHPPPDVQWSQEVLPFPSKYSDWEFHATVFDLSVCGVNILGGSGSQWPALIDTGACHMFCSLFAFCSNALSQALAVSGSPMTCS